MNSNLSVLFISSGTRLGKPSPIVLAQGTVIETKLYNLEYFLVRKKGFFGYLNEAVRLRRFLKRKNFDLIHAHYGLSGLVALMGRKKHKLVVSFMGTDLLGAENKQGSLTKESLVISKINSSVACHYYDHCIVKSIEMNARLKSQKKSLIPNGVNLEIFKPQGKIETRKILGFDKSEKIVIFVSDPTRNEKNFSLAEEAISLTEISDIKLLTVFDQSQHELVNYYNACDLLILTSFHEGSPNVIKEAMACNTPIVATDVGDVKWVMEGVDGCRISSFDPHEYALCIKQVMDFTRINPKTNGRDRIIELGLDSETIANRIINIYREVTG